MSNDDRTTDYFTNAIHKDCGGLIRVMFEVTDEQKRVGFMCAKCHAMWASPSGTTVNWPPSWVEKGQK